MGRGPRYPIPNNRYGDEVIKFNLLDIKDRYEYMLGSQDQRLGRQYPSIPLPCLVAVLDQLTV